MAIDARPGIPGWVSPLLAGLLFLLAVAGLGVGFYPAVDCPKCKGRGLHRMIDAQGPPEVRGVEFQAVVCDCCSDRMAVSLFRRWHWSREDTPKPPVYRN